MYVLIIIINTSYNLALTKVERERSNPTLSDAALKKFNFKRETSVCKNVNKSATIMDLASPFDPKQRLQ